MISNTGLRPQPSDTTLVLYIVKVIDQHLWYLCKFLLGDVSSAAL